MDSGVTELFPSPPPPVDSLPASSMGIITSTTNRQHDPLFRQATGVRLALAGRSLPTNRQAAGGFPVHQILWLHVCNEERVIYATHGMVCQDIYVSTQESVLQILHEGELKTKQQIGETVENKINTIVAVYTRACSRVCHRERGERSEADSAMRPPPTRLAAKTSAGEFV